MNGYARPSLQLRPLVNPSQNISYDHVLRESESDELNKDYKTNAQSSIYSTKLAKHKQVRLIYPIIDLSKSA